MAGKDFGKANAYFKANYYHDFAGGGAMTTGTVNYENDTAKNWEEIGIGGNVQLSKNASAYAEVRKLFGNVKSNVNFSVGARWSF
jgi:outer membrane autotransporter protein